jgi:hypothetical protein
LTVFISSRKERLKVTCCNGKIVEEGLKTTYKYSSNARGQTGKDCEQNGKKLWIFWRKRKVDGKSNPGFSLLDVKNVLHIL